MVDTNEVAISHWQRRRIEGRVLIPFIEVLRDKLGETATAEVVDETIRKLAAEDGARWAATYGRTMASLRAVAQELWAGGGGMDVQVVGESEDHLDFNVTRCRYAEFYKELGLSDLGFRVHCIGTTPCCWASTATSSCREARRSWKARPAAISDFAGAPNRRRPAWLGRRTEPAQHRSSRPNRQSAHARSGKLRSRASGAIARISLETLTPR
jgi:L-2-amino-thiazoline-4-carboxylic acid hydrolase